MNIEDMKDKAYRHGMVSAQIDIDLPLQLRALRKQRGWKQPELAERANMKQPRISAMEKPGAVSFTLETLRRMAEAFDIALIVRFAPFSELWRWSNTFDPDSFNVPEFSQDGGFAMPEGQLAAVSRQMNVNLAGGDIRRVDVPDSMNVLARQGTIRVTQDSLNSVTQNMMQHIGPYLTVDAAYVRPQPRPPQRDYFPNPSLEVSSQKQAQAI